MVDTLFFADSDGFGTWLDTHHNQTTEVWVLFHKRGSGKACQTWAEAVDVALCFGWIDGLRKSIDGDSYRVRFTPRKRNSVWSSMNVQKVEALMRLGKMRPEGQKLFDSRHDTHGYSSETRKVAFHPAYELRFTEHQSAWKNFSLFSPSYRRDAVWWVMNAKKEVTRLRRLDTLISCSALGERVPIFGAKSAPASRKISPEAAGGLANP